MNEKFSASAGSVVAGIDVGGTFTDLLLIDGKAGGKVHIAKTPTTVENQAFGVVAALGATGFPVEGIDLIVHGTTTTTNAVLERRLARTGMITTRGFRDVIELGRRTRPQAYGMTGTFVPVIPRDLPLDAAEMRDAVKKLLDAGCESLVIHFLHSYANPSHERRAAEIAAELWPNGHITTGHALLSEAREFERGVTAAVNASVQPILERYVERLRKELAAKGYARDFLIMNGNGGMISARFVTQESAKTVMSGPASGVIAAAYTGKRAGFANLVTYDMGGTSTDVALIRNAEPAVSNEIEIEYAMPIHVPMVAVHTVGAGGGSIAWVDDAGGLKAGPHSAGAIPGPVGYMRGGIEPTITDANLHMGRLNPLAILGGAMPVDRAAATGAVAQISTRIGTSPDEAADGIIRIAVANMARAIRSISIERGCDVKEFALVAFGGAGPLHAAFVADEVGIATVLVPEAPGTMCARGVLLSNISRSFVKSHVAPLNDASWRDILEQTRAMTTEAEAWLIRERVESGLRACVRVIEARYVGQNFEVRVEGDITDRPTFIRAFYQVNDEVYGYHVEDREIEIVNVRIEAIGQIAAPLVQPPTRQGSAQEARIGTRRVHMGAEGGGWTEADVYDREKLPAGATIAGPAVVEELTATTVLPKGWAASVDGWRNIILTRKAA
ncbi:MAG: hydantoinase/oxoprolinase family protein [Mesorhizobium sp.]|nr:MAG: hydantoinase/oxoprolinase family protein [Mesorhizobium sp.]